MSDTNPNPNPRYATIAQAARYFDRDPKSLRNWASKRWFRLHRFTGRRGILVDLNEVEEALRAHEPEMRPTYGTYGGAEVVTHAPQAEVVVPPSQDRTEASR